MEPSLPRFTRPYDWSVVDAAIRERSGAILEGFLGPAKLRELNDQFDTYLETHSGRAAPETGNELYDLFLGHRTLRLHGLAEKIFACVDVLCDEELVGVAERLMQPIASSVLLNAGELIQIQPGEPAQLAHRDSDSWPVVPLAEHPVVVNALLALDDCTLENGATHLAPGSHAWPRERQAGEQEFARAVMRAGDGVFFRGDAVHHGGANRSEGRRRVVSLSYCAGWLRPVENSFLNVPLLIARRLPKRLQAVLGYAAHDGTAKRGGVVGLYENGDPARALADPDSQG